MAPGKSGDSSKAGSGPPESRWASEDEDVGLMLRFRHGDLAAFDSLVQRNTGKIHALIYRFLGDSQQAEDLTQEVFMRVYRTAHRYEPTAKFSTWLYRIVANLSFNVLRSRRKDHARQIDTTDDEDELAFYRDVPDESAVLPHHRMHDAELRERIAQAVNDLPENQKVAIVLNKYEHKSYEEIAEILDCSTMAVKSLLSRARENLRKSLWRYLRPN